MTSESDLKPGTMVRVIDGTFAGLIAEVLSLAQAQALYPQIGGEPPYDREWPGLLYVALTFHGVRMVICLQRDVVSPEK